MRGEIEEERERNWDVKRWTGKGLTLSDDQGCPRPYKWRATSSRRAGTADKAEGSIWNLPLPPPHHAWPVAWSTRKRSDAKTVFIIHALWTGAHARTRKNQFPFLPAFTRFVRTVESCPLGFSLDSHGLREFNWILPASYIFLHFSLSLFLSPSFQRSSFLFLFSFVRDVYLFFRSFAIRESTISNDRSRSWKLGARFRIGFFFFFFLKN